MQEKHAKIRSDFVMPAQGARQENTFGTWSHHEERLNFKKGTEVADPKENNYFPPQFDTSINRTPHVRGMASSHYR